MGGGGNDRRGIWGIKSGGVYGVKQRGLCGGLMGKAILMITFLSVLDGILYVYDVWKEYAISLLCNTQT